MQDGAGRLLTAKGSVCEMAASPSPLKRQHCRPAWRGGPHAAADSAPVYARQRVRRPVDAMEVTVFISSSRSSCTGASQARGHHKAGAHLCCVSLPTLLVLLTKRTSIGTHTAASPRSWAAARPQRRPWPRSATAPSPPRPCCTGAACRRGASPARWPSCARRRSRRPLQAAAGGLAAWLEALALTWLWLGVAAAPGRAGLGRLRCCFRGAFL